MRLASPWTPRLAGDKGPPSERLAAALAEDIGGGVLAAGARLPPHRDLAYRLGIGIGTVTRAYAVLERRGLVESVHGRGTFVAGGAARPAGPVDLAVNTPPAMLGEKVLAATLASLSRRIDPDLLGSYQPPGGRHEHRLAMARWLERHGLDADPERLVLCHGAQHALSIAFAAASRPGATILAEAATYPGALALARQGGYRLQPVGMDGEGMRPDLLDRALAALPEPRLVYLMPTLQNPTTATMGSTRREEIARVCRARDAVAVEDDVYALCAEGAPPPLSALMPERCFHVSSLSKSLSPGLRFGALVAPPAWHRAALDGMRATSLMVSPLSCQIVEQWLADGTAQSVAAAIRAEARARTAAVRAAFGGRVRVGEGGGFHAWLPLPRAAALDLTARAAAAGIAVTAPDTVMVDPEAGESGVRLCLGRPPAEVLRRALATLAGLLDGEGPAAALPV
ncbi:MAG TPA: PLP-dependent aminotransferase family protein [Azospirillaceae bacterium]|nr:PLP-dependent aminotransferase family protein [Azospirillaceae bacterium]